MGRIILVFGKVLSKTSYNGSRTIQALNTESKKLRIMPDDELKVLEMKAISTIYSSLSLEVNYAI